ncbi:MAG: hypothetical protein FD152_976 [Xanthobacteraceae bacterium]|nr:MAG: hypothetical protein FD152_976 [Xanthobacteraceae bacterium]
MGSKRTREEAEFPAPTPTALSVGMGQALQWSGFNPQGLVTTTSGPFPSRANEQGFVRLDLATYNAASVTTLESEADLVRFVDQQALNAWGYDLNQANHAHQTAAINELRFVISRDGQAIGTELKWLGYDLQDGSWVHLDRQCMVPALGPDFTAPIYPCLGWVLLPGAVDEFGAAEQRFGFCTTTVPTGALANHATRAFSFVYDRYPQRSVIRRRIVTPVDPAVPPGGARTLVEGALALTYGDA